MTAGQAMPWRTYSRVAGMLASARPSVPIASVSAMPRAGAPGTISVDSGMALTTANSNAAMATTSIGRPIQR